MYKEVEEELHTFLTSELDAGERLASCLAIKVFQKNVNLLHQAQCTLQVADTGESVFTEIR